jgi:hypothetical protein
MDKRRRSRKWGVIMIRFIIKDTSTRMWFLILICGSRAGVPGISTLMYETTLLVSKLRNYNEMKINWEKSLEEVRGGPVVSVSVVGEIQIVDCRWKGVFATFPHLSFLSSIPSLWLSPVTAVLMYSYRNRHYRKVSSKSHFPEHDKYILGTLERN